MQTPVRRFWHVLVLFVALLGLALPAHADGGAQWRVDRLIGGVFVQKQGAWVPLSRGAMIDAGASVLSDQTGRAVFMRGSESIELAPGTAIRIQGEGGGQMTTVILQQGQVAVNADKKNFQHFSVQTPYLAAIVKGTVFVVRSGGGRASVDVIEGLVQVQDVTHGLVTDVAAGQSAAVSESEQLAVAGPGKKRPVVDFSGAVVGPAQQAAAPAPAPAAEPVSQWEEAPAVLGEDAPPPPPAPPEVVVPPSSPGTGGGTVTPPGDDDEDDEGDDDGKDDDDEDDDDNSGNGNNGNGNNGNHGHGNNGNGGNGHHWGWDHGFGSPWG